MQLSSGLLTIAGCALLLGPLASPSEDLPAFPGAEGYGAGTPGSRAGVDSRIVADVHEGTGAIIDSQWEVDGWPQYQTARPPQDLDRDGMPDRWEQNHGLNPKDATDSRGDRDGDGYTNIEEYFHSLEA